jgi:hypothetical protein
MLGIVHKTWETDTHLEAELQKLWTHDIVTLNQLSDFDAEFLKGCKLSIGILKKLLPFAG